MRALGAGALTMSATLAGCSGDGGDGSDGGGSDGGTTGLADVEPADTINWISQKYGTSLAIQELIPEFEEETGITVETTFLPYTNYTEKIGNDLGSQSGQFDCFHSDPYAVSSTYWPEMVDLQALDEDPDVTDIPNGWKDFQFVHRVAAGTFGPDQKRVGLPVDCPTLMLAYRKDIFEKYKDQAESDLGFAFEPGIDRSWDEYKQMGEWMNENVDEVTAGIGHQAAQHDAGQNDFHLYYWSQGGTSFGPWEANGNSYDGYQGKVEHLNNLAPRDDLDPNYSAEENRRDLRAPGKPVRRRVYRGAVDELRRRRGRGVAHAGGASRGHRLRDRRHGEHPPGGRRGPRTGGQRQLPLLHRRGQRVDRPDGLVRRLRDGPDRRVHVRHASPRASRRARTPQFSGAGRRTPRLSHRRRRRGCTSGGATAPAPRAWRGRRPAPR